MPVIAALALCCACAPAKAEQFTGQYELKTLESAPGSFELQSQNAWSWDEPARRVASGPDGIEFDESSAIRSRHALELEMGFTSALKMRVGVEFEKERFDEPATIQQANDFDELRLSELGAEVIAVLVPREMDGAGLGVVLEVEGPVDREESSHLTLGGILEFQSGRWFAAAVPMFVYAFGGEGPDGGKADRKWDFAYAVQIEHRFSASWSLALEGYGTIERLGSTGHPSPAARLFGDLDQHRAGPVLYYQFGLGGFGRRQPVIQGAASLSGAAEEEHGASLAIGFGLLQGLNGNTADHTLKLSIELDF